MVKVLAPARPIRGAARVRGVLYLHACPRHLTPHVEWAVSEVLERPTTLEWLPQPVIPGAMRGELSWQHEVGTASRLATSLRGFDRVTYEVTQEPTGVDPGERFSVTPSLGLFHAAIGPHGDILISEDRLRTAMAKSTASGLSLADELHTLLGTAWDEELEPLRYAGDGASVRYLHRVG